MSHAVLQCPGWAKCWLAKDLKKVENVVKGHKALGSVPLPLTTSLVESNGPN